MFLELFCSLLYASLNLYNPLWDSSGTGDQITADERRTPNWHRHKTHFTYLGKIPRSQFAVHFWNCTNIGILTLSQTKPKTLTILQNPRAIGQFL